MHRSSVYLRRRQLKHTVSIARHPSLFHRDDQRAIIGYWLRTYKQWEVGILWDGNPRVDNIYGAMITAENQKKNLAVHGYNWSY